MRTNHYYHELPPLTPLLLEGQKEIKRMDKRKIYII